MGSGHIGLSVVATDVGGGFSIGLGGLGFAMGLSGSWMLFTGLIGAWLSAVIVIPRVIHRAHKLKLLTFPQLLADTFDKRVALVAGVISFIGYLMFTSSQLLAGSKLAEGTFNGLDRNSALLIMGVVAVGYTAFGGIKAVIYTDTFQWILLMAGLIFIGIPISYKALGGYDEILRFIPHDLISLKNVSLTQLLNWAITIIPIWFVGMTLYQRIYACRDEKTAKRAWYIAGLFEYPLMAFMGVVLGLFARAGFEQGLFISDGFHPGGAMDKELGLPLLLRHVLPAGWMGLMLSAYFSAIMSTADSCLLAASGNFTSDILNTDPMHKKSVRRSQLVTFGIGAVAILLAFQASSVLDLMLLSYAFMVSGLLVPVIVMLGPWKPNSNSAFWSMMIGGFGTVILTVLKKGISTNWFALDAITIPFGLDPIFYGVIGSGLTYILLEIMKPNSRGLH